MVPKCKKIPLFKPLHGVQTEKKLLYLMVEALRYRRKVEVSVPEGIIGIFYSHKLSGPTMGLGSNWPLTETITRDIS